MYIEKRKVSPEDIRKFFIKMNILMVIVFVALFFAFWDIQILKNQHYSDLSIQNITKILEIKAPRGLIRDRNYRIMAENKLHFNLFLIKENAKDIRRSIAFACSLTGQDEKEIRRRLDKFRDFPGGYTIPLERYLPLAKAIYVESHADEWPEFIIDIEPARAYPYNDLASHVLGYTAELSPKELERVKDRDYKLGDKIGKSGIELQYEKTLRGKAGLSVMTRDHLGLVREKLSEKKPQIGDCIVLTIDLELQTFIEDLFKDFRGTIGVVDLATGGMLALVGKPNFNPDFFTASFDPQAWSALIDNPDKPLHDKFIQGNYSPGSVFKIVMALAGLEEKLIEPSASVYCSGSVRIYDDIRRCWNPAGHGRMNLFEAIENSCNIYFFTQGKKINIDIIERYARLMGLGERTGIDLPNESSGLVPSRTWKLEKRGQKWFPGDTISIAIGHGMLTVTPVQILQLIGTVALRGKKPNLHLIQRIERDGKVLEEFTPRFTQVPISTASFETVIEGLYRVVNGEGTGRAARVEGLDICGKTGTGQIISKEKADYRELVKQTRFIPHSWFASFAPRVNPRVALVIFVENGGDAGAVAAPLAREIYRHIFGENKK